MDALKVKLMRVQPSGSSRTWHSSVGLSVMMEMLCILCGPIQQPLARLAIGQLKWGEFARVTGFCVLVFNFKLFKCSHSCS